MFAECCVFNKQLQPAGHCDSHVLTEQVLHHHKSVPSPEVTVLFCLVPSPEFSQAPWYSLPDHLCRFAGTVRQYLKLRGFSWKRGVSASLTVVARHQCLRHIGNRICLIPLPTTFHMDNQRHAGLAFSVPPSQVLSGTGILTRFPSTTAFGLALGTDSPCAD